MENLFYKQHKEFDKSIVSIAFPHPIGIKKQKHLFFNCVYCLSHLVKNMKKKVAYIT